MIGTFKYAWFLTKGANITQLGSDINGAAAGDQSGYSVSLNAVGDIVAIGAPYNDGNGNDSGHVRIYSWNATSWTQMGADINGEAADDQSGYSVSLNAAGDRIAIGAINNDGNGANSGHVRIYSWNGTSWTQMGADINGEASADKSGWSVALNAVGDRVAIGARYNDGNGGIDVGHVRVYGWNGIAWTQLGSDINGENTSDQSGWSVSLNAVGDRVAIGARFNDGNGNDSGHVRIYSWNGTSWTQMGADIDGEAAYDWSGYSVSLNAAGDRLAIGAINNDGNGNDSGHVRIYSWNGTSWTQMGADIDGETAYDDSGYSVSLNAAGDRIAIGATTGSTIIAGYVRIYDWNGTAWVQIGPDLDGEATSDQFGCSVSLNALGNKLAIGAWGNNGNGDDSGQVRIYQLS
jgi:hypothetical protein